MLNNDFIAASANVENLDPAAGDAEIHRALQARLPQARLGALVEERILGAHLWRVGALGTCSIAARAQSRVLSGLSKVLNGLR